MLFGTGTLNRRCLPPGKYGKAEPLYRRALNICELAPGGHHPHMAALRLSLARLLQAQGAPHVCCDVSLPCSACGHVRCRQLQVAVHMHQSRGGCLRRKNRSVQHAGLSVCLTGPCPCVRPWFSCCAGAGNRRGCPCVLVALCL
jgi:hypothetical protein